jgi:type IV secretory pathway VirB10-like protein
MRKSTAIIMVGGIGVIVVLVAYWISTPRAIQPDVTQPVGGVVVKQDQNQVNPTKKVDPTQAGGEVVQPGLPPTPPTQPKTLRVPPEFEGFEKWDSERQINAVTDIQRNAHLSPAMRDFLVDLASDPSRRALLRNNAANALGAQDPPVAGWLGKLADQAMDPAESPLWRDYAIQHLSDQLASHRHLNPRTMTLLGAQTVA